LKDADFYLLAETQNDENEIMKQVLSDYTYGSVCHNDDYWSNWIDHNNNFQSNGVAIAINNNISLFDLSLGTGNHCIIAICRHKKLNKWFRIASVHFDPGNRKHIEALSLCKWFHLNGNQEYIDIIGVILMLL